MKIARMGRLGNSILQYLFARGLQGRVPDLRISSAWLDSLGVTEPELPIEGLRVLTVRGGHDLNVDWISYALRTGIFEAVEFGGFAQRLEYYPDQRLCSGYFPYRRPPETDLLDDRHLVINVRGAEILTGIHSGYHPLPIAFYEALVAVTGLIPVLMGQIGTDQYSSALRARLGSPPVIPSISPPDDFAILRAASNLVLSLSTFAWCGGWLSTQARRVHMPVAGFLDPRRRPDVNLLPIRDPRYRFYILPRIDWRGSPEQMAALIDGPCELSTASEPELYALFPATAGPLKS